MRDVQETCRIALVQAEPVMFDKENGLKKALRCIRNAADGKRPESITIRLLADGEELRQISKAAVEAKAFVSIGFSERDAVSGTLYNSNAILSPDGGISIHRKLKPTGSERLVWGDANKDYFPVVETPWGPIGSMI